MMPQPVLVFPVTLPSTIPHKTQAHNPLHIRNPLYSHEPVIDPVYHQKSIEFTSCHFSHYNSTLQQKVRAIANLHGPYLRTICDVNLSPTQSRNIKILFKRDSSSRARTGLSGAGDRGCVNTL